MGGGRIGRSVAPIRQSELEKGNLKPYHVQYKKIEVTAQERNRYDEKTDVKFLFWG